MKRLTFFIMFAFLANAAEADILFQDPTRGSVDAAFDRFSEGELKDLSSPNVKEKQYLLGLLYLHGDEEFHVAQDCQKSVELLTKSWGENVVDAGYALATMYYHGVCVGEDVDKARGLAAKTAREGYILSERMLGLAYLGKKWEKLYPYDADKGVCWLSKAGDAGDGRSAGQLAYMYRKGEGVPQDDRKSFEWLKKSALSKYEKGINIGFHMLAERYEKGVGTAVDLISAYKYYDLSGTAGVEGKQRVAKKMTQEQIDEAIRQSQEWQKEHNVQVGGDFIRRAN